MRSMIVRKPRSKRSKLERHARRKDLVRAGCSHHHIPVPILQCKPQCACGGGCPRCREKAAVQTKLEVGARGDRYEQEADRVAEEVMGMAKPGLQRQSLEEEGEEEVAGRLLISPLVQRQVEPEEDEETLQAKLDGGANSRRPDHNISRVGSLNMPGQPLPASERSFFESRFGRGFNEVRIHTDGDSATAADHFQAHAFTVGSDIVFNRGRFKPNTHEGRTLIAHELTHVVQQKGRGRRFQFKRKDDEKKIFNLVNAKRGKALGSLIWSNKLHKFARGHSNWMRKHKNLVHKSNADLKKMQKSLGYTIAGENIATGYKTSAGVANGWWGSPPHKANILNKEFELGAVGISKHGSGAGRYITQHFGGISPKLDLNPIGSKQSGDTWTHTYRGKVSDNIDTPDKIKLVVAKITKNVVKVSKNVKAKKDGSFTVKVVTKGITKAKFKVTATDSHGNATILIFQTI